MLANQAEIIILLVKLQTYEPHFTYSLDIETSDQCAYIVTMETEQVYIINSERDCSS